MNCWIVYHELAQPITNTQEDIINACQSDQQYQTLSRTIASGFSKCKKNLDPLLHDFWTVRDQLSAHNNIALFDQCLVIPKAFRKHKLLVLHLAHQGVTNMQPRANATIYCLCMNASVRNTRYACQKCKEHPPSQSQEPTVTTPAPVSPFQKVGANYFEAQGHFYLTCIWMDWYISLETTPNQHPELDIRMLFTL